MMRNAYSVKRAEEYTEIYGPPDRPRESYLNRMKFIAHLIPDGSVLDVACGQGHLYGQIKRPEYIGVDSSPSMIAVAKRYFPEADFRVMDAFNLRAISPQRMVVATSFFIHLEQKFHLEMLQRMWDRCVGCLVFTIPLTKDQVARDEHDILIVNVSLQTFLGYVNQLHPHPENIVLEPFPHGCFGNGMGDYLVRLSK